MRHRDYRQTASKNCCPTFGGCPPCHEAAAVYPGRGYLATLRRTFVAGGLLLLAGGARLAAQTSLTAADVAQYLDVLAADSMRGRVTPSPALERTAQYVAAQFRQLGLETKMSQLREKTWVWHYPVPGQLTMNTEQSHVVFELTLNAGGKPIAMESGTIPVKKTEVSFATAVHFVDDVGPPKIASPTAFSFSDVRETGSEHVLVVAGQQTAASAARLPVQGAVVVYLPVATDSAGQAQILRRLYEESDGVVLVSPGDSAQFSIAMHRARRRRIPVVDPYLRSAQGSQRWPWAVAVSPETVRDFLEADGLDFARLRTDTAPTVWRLPLAAVWLRPKVDSATPLTMAPVVAAVLPGSDSLLQREYVILSATLDEAIAPPGAADSVDRMEEGGTGHLGPAGLLALAQAFSRSEARPRRSLIFLATSGGAGGKPFWGTNAYLVGVSGLGYSQAIRTTVAALDLDRLSVPADHAILVDGLQEVALVPRFEWLLAQHPDIGLTVRDGDTVLQPSSGQFPFVQFGVPSLSFHAATRPGEAADGRRTAGVTAEQILPVLHLIGQVAKTIADADARVRWTSEAQVRLADLLGK